MRRYFLVSAVAAAFHSLVMCQGAGAGQATPGDNRNPEPVTTTSKVVASESEASQLVAYADMKKQTMFITNKEKFALAVQEGVIIAEWEPGQEMIMLQDQDGDMIELEVQYVPADEVAHRPPSESDIRLLDKLRKLKTSTGREHPCEPIGELEPDEPEGSQGFKAVDREYTFLEGEGTVKAAEFYDETHKYYYYRVEDCSSDHLGNGTRFRSWVVTVQPWPKP